MFSSYPYWPFYPYRYEFRQSILDKILACHSQNRWIRLSFRDGTNVEAYLRSYDLFRGALIYVPLNNYQIICNGLPLVSVQSVQNCIGKTASLTLPNNMRLSFTIEGADQYGSIGGWLNLNELLSLSAQVLDVTCVPINGRSMPNPANEGVVYEPNQILHQISYELQLKVIQAIQNADLSTEFGIRKVLDDIALAFYDAANLASSHDVSKFLYPMLEDVYNQMYEMVSKIEEGPNKPSDIILQEVELAGKAIRIIKLIAPGIPSEKVLAVRESYRPERQPTISKEQLLTTLGIGLGFAVGLAGGVAIGGGVAATIGLGTIGGAVGAATYWIINTAVPKVSEVIWNYGIPCAECYKKHPNDWANFEICLVNQFNIEKGEAARLAVLYREAVAKGLPLALQKVVYTLKRFRWHTLPISSYYYHQ